MRSASATLPGCYYDAETIPKVADENAPMQPSDIEPLLVQTQAAVNRSHHRLEKAKQALERSAQNLTDDMVQLNASWERLASAHDKPMTRPGNIPSDRAEAGEKIAGRDRNPAEKG